MLAYFALLRSENRTPWSTSVLLLVRLVLLKNAERKNEAKILNNSAVDTWVEEVWLTSERSFLCLLDLSKWFYEIKKIVLSSPLTDAQSNDLLLFVICSVLLHVIYLSICVYVFFLKYDNVKAIYLNAVSSRKSQI